MVALPLFKRKFHFFYFQDACKKKKVSCISVHTDTEYFVRSLHIVEYHDFKFCNFPQMCYFNNIISMFFKPSKKTHLTKLSFAYIYNWYWCGVVSARIVQVRVALVLVPLPDTGIGIGASLCITVVLSPKLTLDHTCAGPLFSLYCSTPTAPTRRHRFYSRLRLRWDELRGLRLDRPGSGESGQRLSDRDERTVVPGHAPHLRLRHRGAERKVPPEAG